MPGPNAKPPPEASSGSASSTVWGHDTVIVNVLEVTGGPSWPSTHLLPVSQGMGLMVEVFQRVAGWTVAGSVAREIFLATDDRAEEVARETSVLRWWLAEHCYHVVVLR